jgi:hypothetical protein
MTKTTTTFNQLSNGMMCYQEFLSSMSDWSTDEIGVAALTFLESNLEELCRKPENAVFVKQTLENILEHFDDDGTGVDILVMTADDRPETTLE